MLGEPTNDVDTQMLTALEDLLDTWPGTLIVVSHDRYLLERVTDTQYAVLDGGFRDLPGGVDQYLALGTQGDSSTAESTPGNRAVSSGAELRAKEKELTSTERKLAKLETQVAKQHQRLADHDQTDFEGLAKLTGELHQLTEEKEALEEQWLELSDLLG